MTRDQQDEFFIGWRGESPPATGRFVRRITLLATLGSLVLAAMLPTFQRTIAGGATFDFGNVREFVGILVKEPAPMLVGTGDDDGSVFYLVNPHKHGFEPGVAEARHLQAVSLRGTLIRRGSEVMIEVVPRSVEPLTDGVAVTHPLGAPEDLGMVTLRGEIVDSKCWLGVMNPGHLKPHRACAINCIAGGIPPILVVRDGGGDQDGRPVDHVLLVEPDGSMINERVLPFVAEPVAVRGNLVARGTRRILFVEAIERH